MHRHCFRSVVVVACVAFCAWSAPSRTDAAAIVTTAHGNGVDTYLTSDPQNLSSSGADIPHFVTLMHDPVYRLAIAWQNVAYNQPPHTGFYLGEGMKK